MRLRRFAAVLAAACLTLSGCGFKGLYSAPLPGGADLGNHPYSITAYFANVLDLVPQSAVKVNDVAVGKVTNISLTDCTARGTTTKAWCAKVTMSVNGSVDLPANSHASVQQTSLLGEKYVSLIAPTTNPSTTRLKGGAKIAFVDTTSAPEVEQVLGALSLLLNNGGLNQIRNIAEELNKALGSPERQKAVRSFINQLTTFTGTLNSQKTDITTALDRIDVLAATLNRQKRILTDALDTFPQALKVLSQERGQLVTLLSSLSNLGSVATRVINSTQQDLVSSLKALDPVVTRLAAAGSDFPKALRIMGTFPFPLGVTRQIIRGDYANLDAVVNLSLTDQLCGALPAPLGTIFCNLPLGSANSKQTSAAGSKKATNATKASPLSPMLVGAGK
ncbi:MAG: phospholipid/cholesterol/gamma-HCH transport system substrate-binding protein [Pseudonocardiales bacterium]|jgi:phospholipid/cholesterol/gamma-HCH transport system substrate-binding protein|nr:phospholipid/cholesterol/gamma-HCH transport system substrate-binding protein [Pseudonocardiales bacterium]